MAPDILTIDLHVDRSDGGTDWQIEQDSTEYHLNVRDSDCWFMAVAKRDGCVDFYRYFNQPFDLAPRDNEDYDQIHICDLDDMIERLTKLRDTAKNYFGPEWK